MSNNRRQAALEALDRFKGWALEIAADFGDYSMGNDIDDAQEHYNKAQEYFDKASAELWANS